MCTVSFIATKNGVYITSNRDENRKRRPADLPEIYPYHGGKLLYPRDAEKGGTWIAAKDNGDAAVLLNGAFVAHVPAPPYRNSRGGILLSVISADDPANFFSHMCLHGIEPFTLVLYVSGKLYDCRWDGTLQTVKNLPPDQPCIWSSATLYNPRIAAKRREWFDAWLLANPLRNQESILAFHRSGGDGDAENALLMQRNGTISTVSITSLHIQNKLTTMQYWEAASNKTIQQTFQPGNTPQMHVPAWRLFLIRLRHWEYWPYHVVHIPVFFYWFWLSCKARSLFFGHTANPGIRNGGFLMESKKEIYDLLPAGSFPATALLVPGAWSESRADKILQENQLVFPLIAKPDIGLRGLGVKLLQNREQWQQYHQKANVDYLLQEYINYPNEAGIFYYRLPGSEKGHITGVVAKELLSVTGDGISTLRQLLQANERFLLQLPVLQATYGKDLLEVLPAGEEKILVPYGNHCRGARFLDRSQEVNQGLHQAIDTLCRQVDGFYFGRLDIRYQSWTLLCEGKAFSVIELNGSGSEPAHIYDPRHSIFFGWKEIMRHLHILYTVSLASKKRHGLQNMTLKEGLQMLKDNSKQVAKLQKF